MPNNTGWAALSGLLRGLEGFPEGLMAGEKVALARQALQERTGERQARQSIEFQRLNELMLHRLATQQHQKDVLEETKRFHTGSLAAPERAVARERESMEGLRRAIEPQLPPAGERAEYELGSPGIPELASLAPILPFLKPQGATTLIQQRLAPPKTPSPTEELNAATRRIARAYAEGRTPDPYDLAYVNSSKPGIVIPEKGLIPRTEAGRVAMETEAPRGGVPLPARLSITADKPIPQEKTRQIASGRALGAALNDLDAALQYPRINEYLGPISQYKSSTQRLTQEAQKLVGQPMGIGPPPAVISLEQNLKTLSIETRRLATGAQMSYYEVEDIMGQLPRQDRHQLPEFRQRLAVARRNVTILRQMSEAGLTDQQRLKLEAMLSVSGQSFPRESTSPTSPRWQIERVR